MNRFFALIAASLCSVAMSPLPAAHADTSSWTGVQRVVVFGDLHGEADKFEAMLHDAGLVDASGNWSGGQTHFVQLGDVPDRGPNSRAILDHLMRLEPQARAAGGYVHALIGNHEAMNFLGDLRYTSAGEFASYADRDSAHRREQYYQRTITYLRAHPTPGAAPQVFDDAYRRQWEANHPLGYVELRNAWSPSGVYGRWIAQHDAVIRINDMVFMHGGIGPTYPPADRAALNGAVQSALRGHPVSGDLSDILENENGPLWYRGLAVNAEASERANVDALLQRFGASHIVLGHTKRAPLVLPRFGGKVILTDIAVGAGATDPHAFLIVEGGAYTAVYRGQRVSLGDMSDATRCAYLGQTAAIDQGQGPVANLATHCDVVAGAISVAQ
ncbi:MAG: metallophosphoesterase [Terricaulis sp.]